MKNISFLVIFSDNIFGDTKYNDEFQLWIKLIIILRNNEYSEDSLENIANHYTLNSDSPTKFQDNFIDIQLKFFLLRNSENSMNHFDLAHLINDWVLGVEKLFPTLSRLTLLQLKTLNKSEMFQFGKYFYNTINYLDYIISWNNCTVDLNTWKKFKFLLLPESFDFVKPILKRERPIKFPFHHMRRLFDEHVDQTFLEKFKPRLGKKFLPENEKTIIERVFQNRATTDDKEHINRLVTNFYSWRTVSENLIRCQANEIYTSELDINSNLNFANYFALIKYYEALTIKPKEQKIEKYAMWFKNKPADKTKKAEYEGALKDVFDNINKHCPNASWSDFKLIFNTNGAKTKIEWTGDASILNFIFRRLNKIMSFQGPKWHVISHYFYKTDKNDDSLSPRKLSSNSHYMDIALENHLKNLIHALNR